MKKICKQVHLWLAIPVGLVFCMMCITGAILVFEEEITTVHYRPMSLIEPATQALPLSEIEAAVAATLAEGVEVKKIETSKSPDIAYKALLSKPKGAAVFVNQYTGQVIGDCGRLKFFSQTQALHRWIWDVPRDGKSVGKSITGWCTVAAFVIVLTGLVLWWPQSRRMLAARFKVKGRPAFAFWYTLHAAGGFYVMLVLLTLIITGLTWSFPAYKAWLMGITGEMSFKPIHTGAFLGIASKIVWFLCAIMGAILPLTGYYFWLRRLSRNRVKNSKTSN